MFLNVSVILSMAVGFPACITGHMTRGVCIQGGLPTRRGVCILRGWTDSPGSVYREVCIQRGWADPPPRYMGYYGIWSTSGRYASYWNVFFFFANLVTKDRGVCIQGGLPTRRGVCILRGWTDSPGSVYRGVCITEGLGRFPPPDTWDTTGYGQQVGGMHPTGMFSLKKNFFCKFSHESIFEKSQNNSIDCLLIV